MPRIKTYSEKHVGSGKRIVQMPRAKVTVVGAGRQDNWENALTGLNVTNVDKRVSATPTALLLKEDEVEALYSSDGIAQKAVDTLPEDMLREGFKFTSEELNTDQITLINTHINEVLNWRTLFQKAMAWADLYGGAAILLGVDDGSPDPKNPLDMEKGVSNFNFATVLSRYELKAKLIQDNPLMAGYGMPATYEMDPRIGAVEQKNDKKGIEVHATRLLVFQGSPLPRKEFVKNGYWADSILSKLYGPLRNYGTTHDSVASLMQDFSQAVFKIKNLADILSAKDGKALIRERINMVELSRSVINATIIADDEEFERKTTSLAGVQEIIEKMERRLVSTTSYPHTILLGESPGGGIGNDGKSQHRDYYDFVARRQESILKQPLRRFLHLVLSSREGPTGGKVPLSWDIEFNPLWQDSETEIMEQRKQQAEADEIYINTGVLSADEIALARFGGPRYSHDTKLLLDRDATGGDLSLQPDPTDPNPNLNPDPDPLKTEKPKNEPKISKTNSNKNAPAA